MFNDRNFWITTPLVNINVEFFNFFPQYQKVTTAGERLTVLGFLPWSFLLFRWSPGRACIDIPRRKRTRLGRWQRWTSREWMCCVWWARARAAAERSASSPWFLFVWVMAKGRYYHCQIVAMICCVHIITACTPAQKKPSIRGHALGFVLCLARSPNQ